MRTRRSWRNQNRIWKMLCHGDFQTVTSGNTPKPEPKPALPIPTDAEVDAMWWISKTSKRLLKLDYAKRRLKQ